MANVNASKMIAEYSDDFGNTYPNFTFKFEDLSSANADDLIALYADRPANQISCGTSNLFSPRKMVIVFSSGESIEFPIPALDQVQTYINAAKDLADVACIELIGESWPNVPPAKVNLQVGDFNSTTIAGANRPARQTWNYLYSLDNSASSLSLTTNAQTLPSTIYQAQLAGLTNAQQSTGICSPVGANVGLQPRRYIGKRATDAGRQIVRQCIVSFNDTASIRNFAAPVANVFNCIGYEGQSVKDALSLY